MGASGCCNGTKCETCNEGQTGNCSSDADCQNTKENFGNHKLTHMSGGYFTAEGDFIGIRYKMFMSHSYDHRVVNGALGGQFVKAVKDYLEAWDSNREI